MALLFSSSGEVEVFSEDKKCNKKIVEFQNFGGIGQSVDLLDEELVLLGDKKLESFGSFGSFKYRSVHHPRKGLLGMKFSTEKSPRGNMPRWHTTFVNGNHLMALGGEFGTKAQLFNTVWNGLNLHWRNRTQFKGSSRVGSCQVKVARDEFLLIGGLERISNGSQVAMSSVLRLDITDQSVTEVNPIASARAFHACEIHGEQVLISGGKLLGAHVNDEVYSLTTNTSTPLDSSSSLGRYQHQLLRLGEKIFSFGGFLADGSETSSVQWFDWDDYTWKTSDQSLLSQNTSNLAVTSFPRTAIDCDAGCSCGQAGDLTGARIVGGTEAPVRNQPKKERLTILRFQENSFPWLVALIEEDNRRKESIKTKCSGSLVSFYKC